MEKRQLGKVSDVIFGREDHGIVVLTVHLDFGGSGQGFGGVCLDEWSEADKRRVGTAGGLDLVMQLLDLFKVDHLEQIKGRTVYALRDSEEWGAQISGLEVPAFDGGGTFTIAEWKKRWSPEETK